MLTGCTESMTASAEEIVTQVLESGDEFKPYYGKALLKTYEGEKETGKAAIEEFVNAEGMRKIITTDLSNKGAAAYALNDGKKITSYEEGSDVAYQLDISNEKLPASMTQKEQLTALLEGIKDTHTYELAGEEKILGMDTYHLKIKAKEKGAIIGDMELWVDQKSWLILKSIVYSGDVRSEMVYEEITFSPKFEKDTFTLDLPANAEIKNMEDEFKLETGTVEDAEKMLGEPFLVFDEKDVQLDKVEWQELKGEINRTELSLQYKKDGAPAFTYSVFKKPVGGDIELKGSDYKVRGQMAEYWKEINSITWDENGLRYSIIIEHPEFKMEEVIKMAENMKLSSEE
jgi:outer membrane lipoprotein-sorting protein